MEDKTQYEIFREEFLKATDALRDAISDFGERLSKLLPDIEIPDEEEDTWEMKIPYENNDDIYSLSNDGEVRKNYWSYFDYDRERFEQGNIFPTKQAAELEAKRRNLLTRFRAFRDECNGYWKVDWNKNDEKHYLYHSKMSGEIICDSVYFYNMFFLFGYFKNKEDAERAIKLFGDEIKALFVDCEG